MIKNFTLFGHSFQVQGSDQDTYFASLPSGTDLTDSVLLGMHPYLEETTVSLDVGANIGLYSLALSVISKKGRTYAFEPSPASFEFLSLNLKQNAVSNVEAHQMALGEKSGVLQFHDVPFFTAGSFAVDKGSFLTGEVIGSNFIEVPSITLDEFVSQRSIEKIDLIKIDVEGGEIAVLRGARETLNRLHPKVILEFSSFAFTIHQDLLPQQALSFLKEIFPFIFVLGRSDGALHRLKDDLHIYDFLYDNGIHGPVDNLLCTFEDIPSAPEYRRITDVPPAIQPSSGEEAELIQAPPQNRNKQPSAAVVSGARRAVSVSRRALSLTKMVLTQRDGGAIASLPDTVFAEKTYERLYDAHAQVHDEDTVVGEPYFGRVELEMLIKHGLQSTQTLLDLGCGNGRLAMEAIPWMTGGHYIGADISESMLLRAQSRVANAGTQACSVSWLKQQNTSLALDDCSVDMICAFSVFTHIEHEDTYNYLKEARRVIRPAGRFIFSCLPMDSPVSQRIFKASAKNDLEERWRQVRNVTTSIDLMDEISRLAGWKPLDWDRGEPDPPGFSQAICVLSPG